MRVGALFAGAGGMDLRTAVSLLMLPSAVLRAKHQNGNGQEPWGKYTPAIQRWETLTRPAPEPTETADTCPIATRPGQSRRLSCAFDEWLMGWPEGHVTEVPGITHAEVLRLCGNGVVPQQAEAAIRLLLRAIADRAAVAS